MSRISIQQAIEPVEVDLWGAIFTVKPATRSILAKANEVMEKADKIEDDEQLVTHYAEMLDIRLVPANGKRVKASTLVKRKWEANDLTVPQLIGFALDIRERELERPT